MKSKLFSRALSVVLCATMLLSVMPMSAFASSTNYPVAIGVTGEWNNVTYDKNTFGFNDYYYVIEQKDYTIVPGAVTETYLHLDNASGTRRQILNILEINPNSDDIEILPGYYNVDKDLTDESNWTTKGLTEIAKYYEDELGYNIVGGTNTDLTWDVNQSPRILVFNGKLLAEGTFGTGSPSCFLGVYKDVNGNVSCKVQPISVFNQDKTNLYNESNTKAWEDGEIRLYQAVGVSFNMIVNNGVPTSSTASRGSGDSRSMVGVKADGTLVLVATDGRGTNAIGLTDSEEAEVMISLGCVWAANCDGGGSTTFISKRDGESTFTMRTTPSDGAERPTLHGILIASKLTKDGKFDHAVVTAENEFVTPESSVQFSAVGADKSGSPADLPAEDLYWALADASYGTISADGLFTSNGKVGTVVAQLLYKGDVVGSAETNVVIPEKIAFNSAELVVPYGKPYTIAISATVNGAKAVMLKAGDIVFEQSFGATINDRVMATVEEASGNEGGTLTAKFKYDNNVTATANVTFGIGSKIIYDFEDSDAVITRTKDTVNDVVLEAKLATKDGNGDSRTLSYIDREAARSSWPYGIEIYGDMDLTSKEDGEIVRNGEHSLKLTIDLSEASGDGHRRMVLRGLNIEVGKATTLGMWVYIPADAPGLIMYVPQNGGGDWFGEAADLIYLNEIGTGRKYNENGWHYLTVDLTKIDSSHLKEGKYVDAIVLKVSNTFADYKSFWNSYGTYTVIIDDITLDYSSAVDDREIPIVSDIKVATTGDFVSMEGQTINANTINVYAQVSDDMTKSNYTGLDYSTAKLYIDGVAYTGITAVDGKISANSVNLADGTHTFRFEVSDNAGNSVAMSRTVVINTEKGDVYFAKHDETAKNVFIGSLQYFDIVAKHIENISKLTTTIDLDGMSTWELDHMTVTYGFTASYEIEECYNTATITIEKTGNVEETGEQAIVSIPVRTDVYDSYLWDISAYKNVKISDTVIDDYNTISTPYCIWHSTQYNQRISMEATCTAGKVIYADGTVGTFSRALQRITTERNFQANATNGCDSNDEYALTQAQITAEINSKNSWHIHEAGQPQSKAATCTEDGYTGRVFCVGCTCDCNGTHTYGCDCEDGCGSVIEWGTTIPATGHTWTFVEGVLKCTCGKTFTGTWTDGKDYVDGIMPSDGWNGDCYYVDGVKLIGIQKVTEPEGVNEYYYNFGEDGKCAGKNSGMFKMNEKYYYSIGGTLKNGWQKISDDWYYFDKTSFTTVDTISNGYVTFEFEKNGRLISGQWYNDGIGTKYYYGPTYWRAVVRTKPYVAWVTIDEVDYAFDCDGYICTGVYGVKDIQTGLITFYEFEEDGAFIGEFTGSGLIKTANGTYLFDNGVLQKGLHVIEGSYYYFKASNGAAMTGTYTVMPAYSNGLLTSARTFTFDENGAAPMLNGFVVSGGKTYFYLDDVMQKGLVEVGDKYYYFKNSSGAMLTGMYTVLPEYSNGLLTNAQTFVFNSITGEAVKN